MTNSINLRADLQLAGTWTNITGDVYTAEGISIKRGRQDEASSIEASEMDLALNNRTAKYTPGNPAGAFYGQLQKGTAIRLGMGTPPSSAVASSTTTNTTFTSPTVTAETSGMLLAAWSFGSVGTVTVPAGYTSLTSRSGNHSSSNWGSKTVTAGSQAGSLAASTVSGLPASAVCVIPGGTTIVSSQSVAGSCDAVTATAVGSTTKFTAITVAAGDVLVLANTWSSDPGNSMATAPQDDQVGCAWVMMADTVNANGGPRVQLWARYCLTAATITVAAPGWYYNIADVNAAIWQVRGATEWNSRFQGECASFVSQADLSGNDVRCSLAAGGVLRRRGQGTDVAHSALYRYLSQAGALAYWPLETGTAATALTSPNAGVANLQPVFSPPIQYGAHSTALASDAVLTMDLGGLRAPISSPVTGTNVPGQFGLMVNVSVAQTTPPTPVFVMATTAGTSAQYVFVQYLNPTQLFFAVESAAGSAGLLGGFTVTMPTTIVGQDMFLFGTWAPNLANPTTQFDLSLSVIYMATGVSVAVSSTGNAGTIGTVQSISMGLEPTSSAFFQNPVAFGHLFFTPTARADGVHLGTSTVLQTAAGFVALAQAWANESALTRMTRLGQEEYIFFQGPIDTANGTNSMLLGGQEIDTPLNIFQEITVTDGGELAEPRGFSGFSYRTLAQMSAQPSVQTLDWNAKQVTTPFAQADDDQLLRNDVTVSQINGASARAFQATGALSVNPPPTGVGTYTSSVTVNVANQGRDLAQIANWLLNVGTTPEVRYPSINTQLAASPTTITAISALDVGQRFTLINTPAWVPPAPVDMLCVGLSEKISEVPGADWDITINARPYEPFSVARLDAGNGSGNTAGGLLDSGSSTVTSNFTSVATTFNVTVGLTDDGWSNANCPFDITISGERMTVTSLTGSVPTQSFTVTRSVNGVVKAQVAGTAVDVYIPIQAGLNGG